MNPHSRSNYRREEFEDERLTAGDFFGAISCVALVIVALLLGGL